METTHYTYCLPFLNTRVSQKQKYSLLCVEKKLLHQIFTLLITIKLGRWWWFSPTVENLFSVVVNSKPCIFQQATVQPNPTMLLILHAGRKNTTKRMDISKAQHFIIHICQSQLFPIPFLFCFQSLLKAQNNLPFLSILIILLVKRPSTEITKPWMMVGWTWREKKKKKRNVHQLILEVSKPSNPACHEILQLSGYFYLHDHN